MENLSNPYIEDRRTRFHEEQLFSQPKQKNEEGMLKRRSLLFKSNNRETFLSTFFDYNLADKLSKCYK